MFLLKYKTKSKMYFIKYMSWGDEIKNPAVSSGTFRAEPRGITLSLRYAASSSGRDPGLAAHTCRWVVSKSRSGYLLRFGH